MSLRELSSDRSCHDVSFGKASVTICTDKSCVSFLGGGGDRGGCGGSSGGDGGGSGGNGGDGGDGGGGGARGERPEIGMSNVNRS
eukprot:6200182-Pleurochrysis_carterae.AAC.3